MADFLTPALSTSKFSLTISLSAMSSVQMPFAAGDLFPHTLLFVLAAFVLDALVGDPRWLPHPVVGMGKIIALGEKVLNRGSPLRRKFSGALLTVALVAGVYGITAALISLAAGIHPLVGAVLEVWLIATTLAGKSLYQAGAQIAQALKRPDLPLARERLRWLVSRDPSRLDEPGIVRGTVESLLENFVDGLVSPFVYALIGGAPLAMAFKAVSTLDSMIAYRNERYLDFGWLAAKVDDAANFIPARLGVFILLLAGALLRMPVVRGYRTWRRDARKHPSPNSGNPESAGAGLLGVKLGGMNTYHGKVEYRPEMGEALNPLTWHVIDRCLTLIKTASWLCWAVAAVWLLVLAVMN